MEHRHPYTARGVLTALGKSALYVLFFLGVQLLTGAIYAAIAIAGSALRPGGFDPQSILNGADTATLLADFFIAAGSKYARRRCRRPCACAAAPVGLPASVPLPASCCTS